MNKQEAINILAGMYRIPVENGADEFAQEINKAIDMAIEALNKQTVYEQVKWERDMALQTLEEHGIGLGQKSDWIPVSERLPEGGTSVLVYSDVGHIIGYYDDVVGLWHGLRPFIDNIELIAYAWQPLPEPYKGGDTE